MALARCPRSGKLYDDRDGPVHPDCIAEEEADYQKVRDYLLLCPDATHSEVMIATGISASCMERMVDQQMVRLLDHHERKAVAKHNINQMEALRLHQQLGSEINDLRAKPKKPVALGQSVRQTLERKRRGSESA